MSVQNISEAEAQRQMTDSNVPLLKKMVASSEGPKNKVSDSVEGVHNENNSSNKALSRHEPKASSTSRAAQRLAYVTILVNVILMIIKLVATYLSGSVSVMASLADSIVDITSGVVIAISSQLIKKSDRDSYPRGRSRLEPLALIIISVIMVTATMQLIIEGLMKIHTAYLYYYKGEGVEPQLNMELPSVIIMVLTVVVKLVLYIICRRYWYYLDPLGGILVSLYIAQSWLRTGWEFVTKLSGKSAEPELIAQVTKLCVEHDRRILALNRMDVYHYGTKCLVEVHIVLDETMPLRETHQISKELQKNIENLDDVEFAFVHSKYDFEQGPKAER